MYVLLRSVRCKQEHSKENPQVIELEHHPKPALGDREVTATTISALADDEAEPSSITVNSFRVKCRSQNPSTALNRSMTQ